MGGRPTRQPRYGVTQHLLVRIGHLFRRIIVRNRSEQGMMVEAEGLRSGDVVTIELPSGRLVDGTVRWVTRGRAGIQLSVMSPPLVPYTFDRVDSLKSDKADDEALRPLGLFSPEERLD